ncbi:MAG: hypothetical protein V3S55_09415 [Nitrospiraceae bacterium]
MFPGDTQAQKADIMFAKLGKLVVLLDKANDDHRRTWNLLKAVVDGEIPRERVKMLSDGRGAGWELLPEEKDGERRNAT